MFHTVPIRNKAPYGRRSSDADFPEIVDVISNFRRLENDEGIAENSAEKVKQHRRDGQKVFVQLLDQIGNVRAGKIVGMTSDGVWLTIDDKAIIDNVIVCKIDVIGSISGLIKYRVNDKIYVMWTATSQVEVRNIACLRQFVCWYAADNSTREIYAGEKNRRRYARSALSSPRIELCTDSTELTEAYALDCSLDGFAFMSDATLSIGDRIQIGGSFCYIVHAGNNIYGAKRIGQTFSRGG